MSNIRELSQLASVIRVDDETRNVGIGTTNPKEALTVVGVVSATSFYGDGSKLSGIIVSSSQESAGIGSTGSVNTTGIITASAFYGNLTGTATTATNLANAADITTGTIATARLSGSYNISVTGSAGYATTAGISTLSRGLTGTPNITIGVVTATSFIKSGGTSSQFLKADGSVDTNTYLTSYTETDTLNSVTGRGNSTSNGISIGVLTATTANFSGIITALSFSGNASSATYATSAGIATTVTNIPNLSGDVSSVNTITTLATVNSNIGTYGDVGAIPRVTVNAKGLVTGVTTVAPNNGTLTLAVSGTGLSGSSTFTANQSGSSTFTVTSNATSDNTNNAIVARNSSGGFSAGIITATQFTTGSGTLGFTTNTISGPAELIIDPAAVGDNTGAVRIKGDLYVDGTQTIINSSTIELADFNVGIATTVGTNSILDGAGIGIGSTGIRKTITWNNTAGALTSSEDWNLVSGKQYEINGTNVLNATTLGSGVVNSSLTSVGTLGQLNVSGVSTFTNGSVFIGSGTSTGTASQRLQVIGGAYVSGNLGVGVTNPGAILDIRGNPWFSPNTTGIKATALRLGRFVDGVNAAYDILTDDSTGDDIEIQSNRYSGNVRISRGSPSGIQTAFQIYSHYQTGSYISIADTTGTTTKVQINEAGNTFFNNSGSVLIGTSSSTGTASQRLQVNGGAYVSGNLGIGTTNPTSRLQVQGDVRVVGVITASSFSGNGSGLTNIIAVSIGTAAPSTPSAGNLWYNSNLGRTFVYYNDGDSSQWVDAAPFNVGITTVDRATNVIGGIGSITSLNVSGNAGIGTVNPQSRLDVRGTISIGRTDVSGINSIRSVTDINSWEYYGVFKSVGTEDTAPQDIFFKSDGTKMFILGDTGNDVNEYSLSTPWEVDTAGFTTNFSVASQETAPLGLYFSSDGLNMYVCGNTGVAPLVASGDYVHQYSLGTAWDISNVGLATVGYTTSYRILDDTAPQGVYLRDDDGTKMYIVGSTGDAIYEYSLGTPWNVSTAGLTTSVLLGTGTLQNLPLTLTAPVGIDFNASGTKMYIMDQTRDVVARFDLPTAWDISTAIFYDNVYIGFQELTPTGIFYEESASRAYVIGSSGDTVYQYNIDVPSLELASSGISTRSSIILNNEARLNNRLYVTGDTHISSNTTLKGTLQVDSTASISGTLSHTGTTANISNTTSANTTNIATGAVASAVQKTINVGTGGATGSRLLVDIGPTNLGASTIRFNSGTNVIIGAATTTGTASQPLQVTGGAYVSGNLGVGVTNPVSRIDAYSPTSGSTAIRATSSSSFSTTLFPGVIAGLSTNASNAYASQFAASGIGVTSGEIGIYSFYPTFANFPADRGPRRAVDLVGGFSTGVWGTEYFSINVGKDGSANDSATLTNERLRIVGTGNLGIGTTNPTSRLQVQGDVRVVGVITCTDIDSTSDINLKTNIKPIDDPLTKVMQLNGVSFDWKETQQPSMGVIAQELEKVFPELVKQSDSHKSVNYNGLIGVLIEAIKEQQKQIEELKLLNKEEKN